MHSPKVDQPQTMTNPLKEKKNKLKNKQTNKERKKQNIREREREIHLGLLNLKLFINFTKEVNNLLNFIKQGSCFRG